MPKVREILKEDDSLETYVKIAIVGNILDFGAFDLGTDIESLIFEGLEKELIINKIDEFEEALKKYDKVLYLVDNLAETIIKNNELSILITYFNKILIIIPLFNKK